MASPSCRGRCRTLLSKLGADGVQLTPGLADLAAARTHSSGPLAISGVDCGSSRHAAMTAGEAGADYVRIFRRASATATSSIIAWWASLFEVPCVALDALPEEEARQLVLDGADFVTPPGDDVGKRDCCGAYV